MCSVCICGVSRCDCEHTGAWCVCLWGEHTGSVGICWQDPVLWVSWCGPAPPEALPPLHSSLLSQFQLPVAAPPLTHGLCPASPAAVIPPHICCGHNHPLSSDTCWSRLGGRPGLQGALSPQGSGPMASMPPDPALLWEKFKSPFCSKTAGLAVSISNVFTAWSCANLENYLIFTWFVNFSYKMPLLEYSLELWTGTAFLPISRKQRVSKNCPYGVSPPHSPAPDGLQERRSHQGKELLSQSCRGSAGGKPRIQSVLGVCALGDCKEEAVCATAAHTSSQPQEGWESSQGSCLEAQKAGPGGTCTQRCCLHTFFSLTAEVCIALRRPGACDSVPVDIMEAPP